MFGWSVEETIGKPIMELRMIYEEDIPIVQSVMQRLTDGKSKHVVSLNRNYTKKREVIHCEWYNSVLRDSAGKMISVMSQVLDITSRKQAEEALHRAEENFRRSLDDSPLGVRIVTIEGETIYANRAILNIYGYDSIEELNTTSVKKRYSPESYAEFQIRKEKREQGVDVPSKYDISIVRKDSEVRRLQVFRKEILWNGEEQFQVIYQDITERKRAEEEKRRMEERSRKVVEDIFRFIPEGVLVFSRKMELLRQNQAFRELVSGHAKRLGFAEDELENLIVDKIKAAIGDKKIKEIRISRKHETGEQT
jgi:PAS domain S-box-containing protein